MPDSFLARIRNMPDTFPARIKEAWLTKAGRWCIKATTPEGTVLKAMVPQWISDAAQELLKPGATAILPSKPPMGFREKEWTEVVSIIGPEPLPVETMPPATPASIPSPGQEGEGKDVTQVAYQAYRAFLDWLDG
jgi:hypothetical protein